MTKPVTGLTTFAGSAPPWSLSQLDADFAALQAAINDLGTYANPLTDTSGTPNTITVNSAGGLTAAYGFGLLLYIKMANTTTSTAVTINLNSLGNVTVLLPQGGGPPAGAFVAAGVYPFIHDGTNFQAINATFASLLSSNNTWTGTNDFVGPADQTGITTAYSIGVTGGSTIGVMTDGAGAANNKIWRNYLASGRMLFGALNDAGTVEGLWLALSRTAAAITGIALGNATDKPPISGNALDMTPDKSSWTANVTGPFTGTGLMKWERQGTQVTVWTDASVLGTSTVAAQIVLSGLPASITPSSQRIVTCDALTDANVGTFLGVVSVNTNNTLNISLCGTVASGPTGPRIGFGNFTGSGSCGLIPGWSITYSL